MRRICIMTLFHSSAELKIQVAQDHLPVAIPQTAEANQMMQRNDANGRSTQAVPAFHAGSSFP